MSARLLAVFCASVVACLAALWAKAPAAESAQADMLSTISVPAGFRVELAAGPPLVERPMLAAFDDEGRLYVCDSAGVNLRGAELSKNPPHVIRVLEDSDGDGHFDRSRVFADKLVFPQGIAWHDGSIYCSSPPSFWKLTDADGDGAADKREELVTGFANTGVADDMHGGSLGPDGRLYWCAGRFPHSIHRPGEAVIHQGTAPLILRCRPDGSDLEVVCGSQGNAVGVAFSPEGDLFASGTFLAPNSMGAGLRDALVHCVDGAEYPVRDRTLREHKRTGEVLPPLTHLGVSASSDLMLCRSDALGDGYRGNLLSALFNMHKVVRHTLERTGATFACRNEDFLVSTHADFHPTDVFEDADGSILVIDTGGWFRIGCPTSQLAKPDVLGGIYRVRRETAAKVADPRGSKLSWSSLGPEALAGLLADPRFEVRDRAARRLSKLGGKSIPSLASVLDGKADAQTKCAAVWSLASNDDPQARALVRAALQDVSPAVRQAAARAAGLHRDSDARKRLMALVTSDEPTVRREAATALGRIGQREAVPALLEGLNGASDRFLEHAIIFAMIRLGDREQLAAGLASTSARIKRGALIALDQMDEGNLAPEAAIPLLSQQDPLLRETALWVIQHHAAWGADMRQVFEPWLARRDLDDESRAQLATQLVAFAANPAIQELIGVAAENSATPLETRLTLFQVMAEASLPRIPPVWAGALIGALAEKNDRIVGATVATLRGLPLEKRPVIARVDAQVNYPMTESNFASTRLSANFCARWMGLLRVERDCEVELFVNSDDGSRLFIDNKLLVDNGGSHAMREFSGRVKLTAGDHPLLLEFVQGEGEAGCILSWKIEGQEKSAIPASAFFHRPRGALAAAPPMPGLAVEFYELGGASDAFPDLRAREFVEPLARVALDTKRPPELRVQAAAVAAPRLPALQRELFEFLLGNLEGNQTALVRLDAAEALGSASLGLPELRKLAAAIASAGALEAPRLVRAFEQTADAETGLALVAALARSPGLKAVEHDRLAALLSAYPAAVQQQGANLLEQLSANREKQKSRLAELEGVLAGGDIQRGRELFTANKKAICATCHNVQGQGGKIGPDLTKIGAIRAPIDLLEAIVFPSASFARGYEAYTVATSSGRVLSGIIARETPEEIFLVDTTRVETRVPRAEIESMDQSRVSIMPEGMDTQLSRQELADLLAFLQSLR